MRGIQLYAIVAAAFMACAFIASPELRAFAANTVGSADIINNTIQSVDIKDGAVNTPDLASNAVTAVKIKDGEVKAAEIATDAVGAAEIQGVTKLLFGQCVLSSDESIEVVNAGDFFVKDCVISGVDSDDSAIATINTIGCFKVGQAIAQSGHVRVDLQNDCTFPTSVGPGGKISVIAFDK